MANLFIRNRFHDKMNFNEINFAETRRHWISISRKFTFTDHQFRVKINLIKIWIIFAKKSWKQIATENTIKVSRKQSWFFREIDFSAKLILSWNWFFREIDFQWNWFSVKLIFPWSWFSVKLIFREIYFSAKFIYLHIFS